MLRQLRSRSLGWPCSTPTLVSHLRRRRARGRTGSPVWAGFQPNPFPASQLPPPPLSCYRVLPTRGNIFMKEWLLCVITVITLSSFTGKVPCVTQIPPTLASKDHTVSFVYNGRFVSLILGAYVTYVRRDRAIYDYLCLLVYYTYLVTYLTSCYIAHPIGLSHSTIHYIL